MKSRERSFCTAFTIVLTFIMAMTAGAQFVQQGNKFVGNDAAGAPTQGASVFLSADGNTAIVGGFHDNSGAGVAWVFTRTNGVWSQQGNKLVGTGAVDPLPAVQGYSVSLSADRNTAIVGGPLQES